MSNTPSLLPCPFCGGVARRSSGGGWYGTGCDGKQSCPAYLRGLMHRTQQDADAEWNRRTPQPVAREPLTDEGIEQATGAKIGTPLFLAAKGFVLATEAAHGFTQKGGA